MKFGISPRPAKQNNASLHGNLCKVFDGIKWQSINKDTFLSYKNSDQAKEQLLNASLAFVESSRGSQGTNSAGVCIW